MNVAQFALTFLAGGAVGFAASYLAPLPPRWLALQRAAGTLAGAAEPPRRIGAGRLVGFIFRSKAVFLPGLRTRLPVRAWCGSAAALRGLLVGDKSWLMPADKAEIPDAATIDARLALMARETGHVLLVQPLPPDEDGSRLWQLSLNEEATSS